MVWKAPWASTFADTYCKLRFDQLVGWSRWLTVNEQEPNQVCTTDYNPLLPNLSGDDATDIE